MAIEFKKAVLPDDLDALLAMDLRIFGNYPADLFTPEMWMEQENYWMICDDERIGCSSFIRDADQDRAPRQGALYIVTTGVLPELQGRGYGQKQKAWQIEFARRNGFTRLISQTRQSNHRMIAVNKKAGFREVKVVQGYYQEPEEAAIVMELEL
jgi:ribosomal protein S18 acetylase RimI-like enzyme